MPLLPPMRRSDGTFSRTMWVGVPAEIAAITSIILHVTGVLTLTPGILGAAISTVLGAAFLMWSRFVTTQALENQEEREDRKTSRGASFWIVLLVLLTGCAHHIERQRSIGHYTKAGLHALQASLLLAASGEQDMETREALITWERRVWIAHEDIASAVVEGVSVPVDFDEMANRITLAAAKVVADLGGDTVARLILVVRPVVRELLEELYGIFDDPEPAASAEGSSG